ncbi:MAG TPA: rhodanese-like domain-containing protein [Spirochaetota bacterium]|nr:rhodanese-like domain-containing protein [Spirochaetota bacterium]HPV42408.1 rhodanese-like domain-containing protein [Spirochaetota bacterium]
MKTARKPASIPAAAVIMAALISASCCSDIAPKQQVKEWIDRGALIVDVRTPAEFARGHYRNAINVPLADIENSFAMFGDRNRLIVVYCRTGNRSGKARAILEKHGYKNVINGGGLKDMP